LLAFELVLRWEFVPLPELRGFVPLAAAITVDPLPARIGGVVIWLVAALRGSVCAFQYASASARPSPSDVQHRNAAPAAMRTSAAVHAFSISS